VRSISCVRFTRLKNLDGLNSACQFSTGAFTMSLSPGAQYCCYALTISVVPTQYEVTVAFNCSAYL
jgi:hypothetical protein